MPGSKQDLAAALIEKFNTLPARQHDWYEALLMAALDEHHGDLEAAIKAADEAIKQDPGD